MKKLLRNKGPLAAMAVTGIALNASAGVITIDSSASFEPTSAFDAATFDASGSDKLVVVATGEHNFPNNTTGQIIDITYDGVSLTKAVDRDPVDGQNATAADIWYLDNPGAVHVTGALDATVSGNGNNYVYTVLALSNTATGVGATAISVPNSKSVDLNALGLDSLVLASHGMGGDGNTANVLFVDADAPATELSALEAGNNWAGHVTSYTNGVGAGNATYSFTGGSTTGVVTIAAEFQAAVGPGTLYCFGEPGVDTPCPCGNDNDGTVAGAGCANGVFASGAVLTGSGTASVTGDTLVLHARHTEPDLWGLFFQGDGAITAGIPWGDGLRCVGGKARRLALCLSDGTGYSDTSAYPKKISVRGKVSAGDTKHYQLWYPNPTGSPCSSYFNASNAYSVTWSP